MSQTAGQALAGRCSRRSPLVERPSPGVEVAHHHFGQSLTRHQSRTRDAASRACLGWHYWCVACAGCQAQAQWRPLAAASSEWRIAAVVSGQAQGANRNLVRRIPFYGRQTERRVGVERSELAQLVEAARSGDPEAFGAVFDRCYPAIYRYAYARLGSVADAEDAAAEAFASALVALPRFRWRGAPFESWLLRIAASKVTDVARRAARLHQLPVPTAPGESDETSDPAQVVARAERRQHLLDAIERLPGDQREVVLLRFFADRSLAEVADSMGRSVGAIKQLQFRAMARLRGLVDA